MSKENTGESQEKTWSEAQQKLLKNWLDTVRKFGGTPTLELWTKTVDAWQAAVKETLDAQAQWTHDWTEKLAHAKGTTEEVRELSREGREQLQHWTDAQRELWKGWFDVVREINFKPESGASAQAGRDLIQFWQDSAHKMIDAQIELVRRWTRISHKPEK